MNYKQMRGGFILVCILSCHLSLAQQVITFDNNNSSYKRNKENKETGKNSFTVGILSCLNGYTPVYYERAIVSFLSVQVGAGITYRSFGNDFGQFITNDGKNSEFVDNAPGSIRDIDDQYLHYRYRKSSLGSYFSVAPRVYFSDHCMDGFFLAPMVEWKNFRYDAQLANVNKSSTDMSSSYSSFESDDRDVPHSPDIMKEYMKCLDLTLNIGGHYQRTNHMVIGWSIGAGVRKIDARRLDVYTVYDATGNDYFRNNVRDYNQMKPLMTFNLTIGGWF